SGGIVLLEKIIENPLEASFAGEENREPALPPSSSRCPSSLIPLPFFPFPLPLFSDRDPIPSFPKLSKKGF
ncbi:hypothetical protein MRB53_034659, partial [Persea americana]